MKEYIVKPKMEIEKTKDMVENILANDERSRNSDIWLILQVWQKKQHIKCFIPYEDLSKMITPETITRVRRKIQNDENRFLPTSETIRQRRKLREEDIKQWAIKSR